MNMRKPPVRYSVHNLSLGRRNLTEGIEATREFLSTIGATDGLAWTPTIRSRLYAEMSYHMIRGTFTNRKDESGLIASMNQSFAPTVPEAIQRYRNRAGTVQNERLKRLGTIILKQRGLMPSVRVSLIPMKRIAEHNNDDHLFANLYAEELPPGTTYNDQNAPYARCQQITPDVLEKLGTTIFDLPAALQARGIAQLSFTACNAERYSQTGRTQLPSWDTYLPLFARQGLLRQVVIPLNSQNLLAGTGMEHARTSLRAATELVREHARPAMLGPLPDQLACVLERAPMGQPLDITVSGNVSDYSNQQLANIYRNLRSLVANCPR